MQVWQWESTVDLSGSYCLMHKQTMCRRVGAVACLITIIHILQFHVILTALPGRNVSIPVSAAELNSETDEGAEKVEDDSVRE